jgi:hypothetical protein
MNSLQFYVHKSPESEVLLKNRKRLTSASTPFSFLISFKINWNKTKLLRWELHFQKMRQFTSNADTQSCLVPVHCRCPLHASTADIPYTHDPCFSLRVFLSFSAPSPSSQFLPPSPHCALLLQESDARAFAAAALTRSCGCRCVPTFIFNLLFALSRSSAEEAVSLCLQRSVRCCNVDSCQVLGSCAFCRMNQI